MAGYLQITGRTNYQKFADYMQDPKIMDGAEYVAKNFPFSSASFWWSDNSMNALIDQGASVEQVSTRVNGANPANGLADRLYYYQRCLDII